MDNYNFKKGLLYSVIGAILIGLQPVIANSRPVSIDAYIFAAVTALFEAIIFLPIYLIERKKYNSLLKNSQQNVKPIPIMMNKVKFLFFFHP
jgi:hypothetical protein